MSTSYTSNYNLGKQLNHGDKFDMSVITDNMDIIDRQMKENADTAAIGCPEIIDGYITSEDIEFLKNGTVTGVFNIPNIGILTPVPGSSYQPGILRAYTMQSSSESGNKLMQILELAEVGMVFVRYHDTTSWGNWKEITEIYRQTTTLIDNSLLSEFYHGTYAGQLATEVTGAANTMYGIVRAYKMATMEYMQIAEAADGTRRTRYCSGTTWGAWG
ncbi:hypothetical protein [uncultured Ruminococcus sp.]|uniref:hypothetical protein n=1 Tax=uncultured Ruminococcus sp. TaxID=165186 RepID=UPI0025F93E3B|nr:hypothetical protein [uncultured Ruminococcus sp.]